jgi:hypothetical protein
MDPTTILFSSSPSKREVVDDVGGPEHPVNTWARESFGKVREELVAVSHRRGVSVDRNRATSRVISGDNHQPTVSLDNRTSGALRIDLSEAVGVSRTGLAQCIEI